MVYFGPIMNFTDGDTHYTIIPGYNSDRPVKFGTGQQIFIKDWWFLYLSGRYRPIRRGTVLVFPKHDSDFPSAYLVRDIYTFGSISYFLRWVWRSTIRKIKWRLR